MAIEREVLQDITKYKARIIGPFTKRQAICVGIAGGWSLLVHSIMKSTFYPTFILGVAMAVAIPALICGFIEPYDMPMEKFALELIRSFLSPPVRKYKQKTNVELIVDYLEAEEKKKNPRKVNKKEVAMRKKEALAEYPALTNTFQKSKRRKKRRG